MFSFWRSKAGERPPLDGKAWGILLLAALGVVLLLFGNTQTQKKESTTDSDVSFTQDEMLLYQSYLETRVKTLCESVGGVGDVTAIVTLSGSFEAVYATEWHDGDEEYVVVGSGSGASALLLSRTGPGIVGVGVVCRGAEDASVRAELTSLLCAAFDIPANRIHITAAKK